MHITDITQKLQRHIATARGHPVDRPLEECTSGIGKWKKTLPTQGNPRAWYQKNDEDNTRMILGRGISFGRNVYSERHMSGRTEIHKPCNSPLWDLFQPDSHYISMLLHNETLKTYNLLIVVQHSKLSIMIWLTHPVPFLKSRESNSPNRIIESLIKPVSLDVPWSSIESIFWDWCQR